MAKKKPETNDIQVTLIPVSKIRPNTFNPNRMTEEKLKEFEAEVRHLGRPPKPLVVRRIDDNLFELVDGEHGFRVVQKIGWETVPCEVVDADDFEAMRQCHKRNLHGQSDKVALGRMFRQMMEISGLKYRHLAEEIEVPGSTIRLALLYARCADLRNSGAESNGNTGDKTDAEISKLPARKVLAYCRLSKMGKADAWLDAGGDLAEAERMLAGRSEPTPPGTDNNPDNLAVLTPLEAANGHQSAPATAEAPLLAAGKDQQSARQTGEDRKPAGPSPIRQLMALWEKAKLPTRKRFVTEILTEDKVMQMVVDIVAEVQEKA